VVNLIDPALTTRGALAARLRADGWTGRVAWVPISVLASALTTARAGRALAHGRRPGRFAAWSILRPRRYDARLATALLDAVARDADAVPVAPVTVPA